MEKTLAVIAVLIIGTVGLVVFFLGRNGIDIKVINQTNKEISGMYLTYDNIKSDIKIASIASGETYKLNVNTIENSTKEFNEGALLLKYIDDGGSLHTEYTVGYIEKGYSGNAVLNLPRLKSQDSSVLWTLKPFMDLNLASRIPASLGTALHYEASYTPSIVQKHDKQHLRR